MEFPKRLYRLICYPAQNDLKEAENQLIKLFGREDIPISLFRRIKKENSNDLFIWLEFEQSEMEITSIIPLLKIPIIRSFQIVRVSASVSALVSAKAGAAIGSILMPGLGTIIGGVIGGMKGIMGGLSGEIIHEEDINKHLKPVSKKEIFISYSHKDSKWLDLLLIHLSPLVDNFSLNVWTDRNIEPGSKWIEDICNSIQRSSAAILLVSPNFLASSFIKSEELVPLLKKSETENLKIFWIYISPCLFDESKLKDIQSAHSIDNERSLKGMKPVDRDKTLVEVMKKIRQVIQ